MSYVILLFCNEQGLRPFGPFAMSTTNMNAENSVSM